MNSETITKNDLIAILQSVGIGAFNIGDRRKLLWTNPDPSSVFESQDVLLTGAYDEYDFIEIEYKTNATYNYTVFNLFKCKTGSAVSMTSWNGSQWEIWHRSNWWSDDHTKIHFDTAYYNALTSSATTSSNNALMIPYRIWGIKAGTGYRQDELLITDEELETLGTALGLTSNDLSAVLNSIVTKLKAAIDEQNSKVVQINSVSDFITTNSGFPVSSIVVRRYGKVYMAKFIVKRNASWSAGSTGTVGQIKSAYRPMATCLVGGATFTGLCSDGGTLYLRPITTVAANSEETVTMTYIVS